MPPDNLHATLGTTGMRVFRAGLSASYRPGQRAIRFALDQGVNYLFLFGFDTQMAAVIRERVGKDRGNYVVATGAYNYLWTRQNLRRTLEKRLASLRLDYIDVFHFLGVMKPEQCPESVLDQMHELRLRGLIRATAISCHDRNFAGRLAARKALDVLMIRYNAAHRGAEQDVFPYTGAEGPGVVGYTATRWTALLRRPRGWPKDRPAATGGQCYRFVLSNPAVDVVLMAPRSERELAGNLEAIRKGSLPEDEMRFMRELGDAVRAQHRWFM